MNSKRACIFVICAYMIIRLVSIDFTDLSQNKYTDSDGLGYYMYLPGVFIYQDITAYEWLPAIEKQYRVYGDDEPFQISRIENGNYVTNYLSGVAVLQLPFFAVGHLLASCSHYPADGFSPPYQLSIAIAPLVYFCFFIWMLRAVLLKYFDDLVVSGSLLLLFLATNAPEYIAIEAGQSHGYVMPLYILILYLTLHWHRRPTAVVAFAVGTCIGLATIMRPTELLMVAIPLLWSTHTLAAKADKWKQVWRHRGHIYWAVLGAGLVGAIHVVYWLHVTGQLFYPVGSKWRFLDPYWRVLVGWEKGWFIYTPVAVFLFAGLFMLKSAPFKKAVFWFCLLNIWIVISWDNWRYGGSYSTRALVQSYPIFAFALCSVVELLLSHRRRYLYYVLGLYLIGVNIFQIWQYRKTIIHYDDNNRDYYKAVYLDRNPTALDMSLLDGGIAVPLRDCQYSSGWKEAKPVSSVQPLVTASADDLPLQYIKVELDLLAQQGFWDGTISLVFENDAEAMVRKDFRLFHAQSIAHQYNTYEMIVEPPLTWNTFEVQLQKVSKGRVKNLRIYNCK